MAYALAYVATLAFAAFVLWHRRALWEANTRANMNLSDAIDLRRKLAALESRTSIAAPPGVDLVELSDTVSTLALQAGLKRQGA